MLTIEARKKIGDLFVDLGKYVLTSVPIAFFVSSAHEISLWTIALIALCGIFLVGLGIYVTNTAAELDKGFLQKKGKLRKIKLTKNTTLTIIEED